MLPAWLPVAKCPEGSMLLYHLSQHHPDRVAPYLQRMETECIATVAAEASEVVEEDKMKSREDRKHEARCMGIWVLAAVIGLLLLYVLFVGAPAPWIGAMAPLITATAALGGVYLGSRLSQRQRREEETQRRRALATLLLSEVRFVE
jgi:hypothetical protein